MVTHNKGCICRPDSVYKTNYTHTQKHSPNHKLQKLHHVNHNKNGRGIKVISSIHTHVGFEISTFRGIGVSSNLWYIRLQRIISGAIVEHKYLIYKIHMKFNPTLYISIEVDP